MADDANRCQAVIQSLAKSGWLKFVTASASSSALVERFEAEHAARLDAIKERAARVDALAGVVDWFVAQPEVDDVYGTDTDLFWVLTERFWQGSESTTARGARRNRGGSVFSNVGRAPRLFEAPMSQAAGYQVRGYCCVEEREALHVLRLGVGDHLHYRCACSEVHWITLSQRIDGRCPGCMARVSPLPNEDVFVSAASLVAGKAAIAKSTDFGLLTIDTAEQDPRRLHDDAGNRIETALLWTLLHTPNFSSAQAPQWLFDEGKPMVYLGGWAQGDFYDAAPDGDGRAWFASLSEDPDNVEDDWDGLERARTAHVFRSTERQAFRLYIDMT